MSDNTTALLERLADLIAAKSSGGGVASQGTPSGIQPVALNVQNRAGGRLQAVQADEFGTRVSVSHARQVRGLAIKSGSKIRAKLGGAASTVYITGCYVVSKAGRVIETIPFEKDVSSTSYVDLVPVAADGQMHTLQALNAYNANGSTQTVTVEVYDGSTTRGAVVQLVPTTETLFYQDGGWYVTFRGTPIPVSAGGTGVSSVAVGALLYGNGVNPLQVLPIGTASQILQVNAGANAPAWVSMSGDATISNGVVTLATVAVGKGGTGTTTAPSSAQILIAQSASAYAPKTMSQDGTIDANGLLTVVSAQGAFALPGDISISIGGDQNDWNPTGLSTASVIRAAPTANRTITGLAGGADGRIIIIRNTTAFALTLSNNSVSSAAANRFKFSNSSTPNSDISLYQSDSVILQYDATLSLWCCIGKYVSTPMFHVYRNASQSIGTGYQKINWDTESYDTHGWFDSSTNYRFTPLRAGKYLFKLSVGLLSLGNGKLILPNLHKNGSTSLDGTYIYNSSGGAASLTVQSTWFIEMNGSSDYVEGRVYNGDSGSLNLNNTDTGTHFEGVYLGP